MTRSVTGATPTLEHGSHLLSSVSAESQQLASSCPSWRSAARFLFGREGLLRRCFAPWRAYLQADFHPSQADPGLALAWLREHDTEFRVVASASA